MNSLHYYSIIKAFLCSLFSVKLCIRHKRTSPVLIRGIIRYLQIVGTSKQAKNIVSGEKRDSLKVICLENKPYSIIVVSYLRFLSHAAKSPVGFWCPNKTGTCLILQQLFTVTLLMILFPTIREEHFLEFDSQTLKSVLH